MIWGAVYGDIIGSYYEVHSTKDYGFPFQGESAFTDDSVMTAAACAAITANPAPITPLGIKKRAREYAAQYKRFFSLFPNAGYGQMFSEWASSPEPYIQRSYANGGTMRVVPIGYAYDDLEQVMLQVKASCYYTHHTREAVNSAKAVAAAVWLARNGETKDAIKKFIEDNFHFELLASLDKIRADYKFDSRAKYSVPPAISAFLQSDGYESAVRLAVSPGGDADTMACIADGIAEAFYGEIPRHIAEFCALRLDKTIKDAVNSLCRLINSEEKMNAETEKDISKFFRKRVRERVLYLLNSKKRGELLDKLAHTAEDYIDTALTVKKSGSPLNPEFIREKLGKTVYVIAANSPLDGKHAETDAALDELWSNGSPYMLCGNGYLYVEAEYDFSTHASWLLKRNDKL